MLSLVSLLGALMNPAPATIDFYIGTYTSPGGSEGIYHSTLNTTTGELSTPTLAAKIGSPSYLAWHPQKSVIYAVDEGSSAVVSAFQIQPGGSLSSINSQTYEGGGPCHVSVSPDGKFAFAASYGGGTLAAFPLESGGALKPHTAFLKNTGSGPDKSRQEAPHMHSIYADAHSKFVYACDLGTDEILTFALDGKTGALKLSEPRATKAPAGGGPRHLAFHPNGKFAFVNNEMPATVTSYSIDSQTGHLAAINTLSTLPPDANGPKSTAEIACHPSGKWLYVSNRGHNSIAVFAIGKDGSLASEEITAAGVKIPRGFAIDPSGHWLVVAGQDSNDIAVLKIDSESGKLKLLDQRIKVSKPVCISFRPTR